MLPLVTSCYLMLPYVTGHVTVHVTVEIPHFVKILTFLPHVTATFYKKGTYTFYKK